MLSQKSELSSLIPYFSLLQLQMQIQRQLPVNWAQLQSIVTSITLLFYYCISYLYALRWSCKNYAYRIGFWHTANATRGNLSSRPEMKLCWFFIWNQHPLNGLNICSWCSMVTKDFFKKVIQPPPRYVHICIHNLHFKHYAIHNFPKWINKTL